MKGKKSNILKITGIIFAFMIFFILIFFGTLFLRDIGEDEVLYRIDNITYMVEDDLGLSEQIKTNIHDKPQEFRDLDLYYDLFFVLSLVSTIAFSIYSSFQAKEESIISFFGIITLGLIGVLFVSSFINVIADWLITNFITGFLEFNLESTPVINWYLQNLSIINFVWVLVIIIVNKFNFTDKREDDEDFTIQAQELPSQGDFNGGFER